MMPVTTADRSLMRMGFFAIFWHTSSVSTHAATLTATTIAAR